MVDIGGPSKGGGDRFTPSEHVGRLVLFAGIEKDAWTDPAGATKSIARVTLVVVMDGPDGPAAFDDVLIFGAALAPSLYRAKVPVVVGVIGQGEAKPGKSAPWILNDATEEQLGAARSWYPSHVGDGYVYLSNEAPF